MLFFEGGKCYCALVLCTVLTFVTGNGSAQAAAPASGSPAITAEEGSNAVPTAPVVIDGVILFSVRGVSAYPAEKRAKDIAARIQSIAANRSYTPQWLRLEDGRTGTQIFADKQLLMVVFDSDARLEGVGPQVLAQVYLQRIGESIQNFKRDRQPGVLIRHTIHAFAGALILIFALWFGHRLVAKIRSALEKRCREKIHDVHVQSFQIIRAEHLWRLLTGELSFVWAIIALTITYLDLHYILSLFPWTRGFANRLFAMLVSHLETMWTSLLKIVPDLIFLAVLVFVTCYLLKLIRLFFLVSKLEQSRFPDSKLRGPGQPSVSSDWL